MGKTIAAVGGLVAMVVTVGVIAWVVLGSSGSSAEGDGASGGGTGYLGSAIAAKDFTEKTVWQAQVQAAVRMHEVQNGAFPEYLEDMDDEVPELPEGYYWDYDPETGTVLIEREE